MRKLVLTLIAAAAVLSVGALARKADAAPTNGAASIAAAAVTTPFSQSVACNGRWGRCPPGRFWNGRRCVWC